MSDINLSAITKVELSDLHYFDSTNMSEVEIKKAKKKLISRKIARLKKDTEQCVQIDFKEYEKKFFFLKHQSYIVLCGINRIIFKKEQVSDITKRVHSLCDYVLFSKKVGFYIVHRCEETSLKYDVDSSISPTIFFVEKEKISTIRYQQEYSSDIFDSVIVVKNERSYSALNIFSIKLEIFRDDTLLFQKDGITVLDELPFSNGCLLYGTEKQNEEGQLPTIYPITLFNCITDKKDEIIRRGWGVNYCHKYPSALYLTELPIEAFPIEDEKNIYFYVAKVDTKAYQAVSEIVNVYGKTEQITSPLEEDVTINERLIIPKTTPQWVARFVYGVITKSNSLYPQFFGVPIQDIIETMFEDLEENPYALPQHYCDKVSARNALNYLRQQLYMSNDDIVRYLVEHYGSYSLVSRSEKYWRYFHEVGLRCEYLPREAEELLNVKLNRKYVDSLDMRVYDEKWKSEYELYLLVKKYFPDAMIHYTAHWLGMQHLDIFIPSLNLAFEYQGEQHYSSLDYFGGKEAYEERVRLDREKKKLCELNKVFLFDWHYLTPITAINLIVSLREKQGNG